MVFDAYTQFEETMISAKMEDEDEEAEADDLDVEGGDDMDLRLARLQYLLDRCVHITLDFSVTICRLAPSQKLACMSHCTEVQSTLATILFPLFVCVYVQ